MTDCQLDFLTALKSAKGKRQASQTCRLFFEHPESLLRESAHEARRHQEHRARSVCRRALSF